MKKFKRIMALVIAAIMVLAMTTAAWADGTTHQDPEKGSITVKSPIMGAAYTGYRIFDLTISESGDSIAYTIDTNSPFYQAVVDYAEATKVTEGEGEDAVDKYALTLSEFTTQTETDTNGNMTYAKYAISVNTDPAKGPVFDAQHFGQAMQKAINGTPAVEDDPATTDVDESQPAVAPIDVDEEYMIIPDYTDKTANKVTLPDTDQITFKNIPLGYYLITNEYPTEERTATFDVPAYTDDSGEHEAKQYKFNKDTSNEEIEAAAQAYVDATIDEDAVNAYIEENNLKDKLVPAGRDLTEDEWNSVKTQLESSTKQKQIESIRKTLEEIKQTAADINVKEPVLVFVDSTTKSAEIFEKNELDKWDVPVNPTLGEADLEDLPEFGEPDGGKNIIVGYKEETVTDPETQEETTVKKPIYADWTEANIGDTVHYELRVNAMNFVREDQDLEDGEVLDNNAEFDVKQVKEYIIGDYQNDSLTFDPAKDKIKVKIVDDNGNTVKIDGVDQEWDYTEWHEKFFLSAEQALEDGAVKEDILENGGGIAIPWALKTTDETEAKKHKNVTSYELITTADDPTTEENEEVKTTYYWYSIYDSDVTIVVDYTMTLTDKATIDMPGNINYSEYGVNYTDKDENDYTPPTPEEPEDREKPDKDSKKDTATVYTYALAIQKVDENGEKLAGATFKIQGLTANELEEGYYKVVSYVGDKKKDEDGNPTEEDTEDSAELMSDKNGLLVIEGFMSSAELTVKEVVAPDGYNILTAPVTMKPIKVGEEVITTAETTNYKYKVDDDGNEIPGTRVPTSSESSSTREKKYFNASGAVVASEETTPDGKTHYYVYAGSVKTETEDVNVFNEQVAALSVTPGSDEQLTTDSLVNSAKLSPLAVQVENKKGQELPSTGGIGTTIFYVVGAILVIGAGVILITRRRMDA